MKNLAIKVELYLGRKPDFTEEVILKDDGDGVVYIKEWNVAEAQPTDEQLNALESQATTLENNSIAIYNRLKEYPSLGDVVDAIFKKEAGDSTEFDALATKRTTIKNKYTKG